MAGNEANRQEDDPMPKALRDPVTLAAAAISVGMLVLASIL